MAFLANLFWGSPKAAAAALAAKSPTPAPTPAPEPPPRRAEPVRAPPRAAPLSPHAFNSTMKVVIGRLLAADNHQERTELRRKYAEELIAQARGWDPVDWRQFSHMHCSTSIKFLTLEGGLVGKSLEGWRQIFRLWRQGGLFSLNLSDKGLMRIRQALRDISELLDHMPPVAPDEPLSDSELEKNASGLHEKVLKLIAKRKSIYLPLGYRHGTTNEAHALACRVELRDGWVYFHPLNVGNGSEPHPILTRSEMQEKISFRSFPIRIKSELFEGKVGRTLFCHLYRYLYDPPKADAPAYQGQDIIDLLLEYGELIPHLGDNLDGLDAKPQRTGTCPDEAMAKILRDLLLTENLSQQGSPLKPKEIKKLLLAAHFTSLVAGFQTYRRAPTPLGQKLLLIAVKKAAIRLEKHRDQLTVEERLGQSAVFDLIHEEVRVFKPKAAPSAGPGPGSVAAAAAAVAAQPSSAPLPPSAQEYSVPADFVPKTSFTPPKFDAAAAAATAAAPAEVPRLPKLPPLKLDMSRASREIELWLQTARALKPNEAFTLLYDRAKWLEIPTWGAKEGGWQTIPQEDIPAILANLTQLVQLALREERLDKRSFFEKYLVVNTFYTIIDALVRRLQPAKLEGFASPFLPLLYDYQEKGFVSIPLAHQSEQLGKISDYFKESMKACKRGVIFPIGEVLPIEEWVKLAMNGGAFSHKISYRGKNHILFLRQFLPKDASNREQTPYYLDLWAKRGQLPVEIDQLYYFAYISHLLLTAYYNTSKEESSIPDALEFVQGTDQKGAIALLIARGGRALPGESGLFWHDPENLVKSDRAGAATLGAQLVSPRSVEKFHEFSKSARPFIDIPFFHGPSTNDAVCARLAESDARTYALSEPIYRDLLRITRKRVLAPILALHARSSAPIQLQHEGIQKTLDRCFFSEGTLVKRLQEAPSFARHLRSFIHRSLDYYNFNLHHFDTLVYIFRTAIAFEAHVAQAAGRATCDPLALKEYRANLAYLRQKLLENPERFNERKLQAKIYQVDLLELFLETYGEQADTEAVAELWHRLLDLQLQQAKRGPPGDRGWLEQRFEEFARINAYKIEKLLEDPGFRSKLLNSLLRKIHKDSTAEFHGSWEGTFPIFSWRGYTFDFFRAKLSSHDLGELSTDPLRFISEETFGIVARQFRDRAFWKQKDYTVVSTDGDFCLVQGDYWILRRTIGEGAKRHYRLHQFNYRVVDGLNLDFFTQLSTAHIQLTHYVPLEEPHLIVSCNAKDDKPFLVSEVRGQKLIVRRADEFARARPWRLLDLSTLQNDKNHPIYQATLRFAKANEIVCFVNEKDGQIEELYFYRLNLSFRREREGLASVEFPGHFLDLTCHPHLFGSFEGVFVLMDREARCLVLMPKRPLEQSREDFSSELAFSRSKESSAPLAYHTFTVDMREVARTLKLRGRVDAPLTSRSPDAYIYAIMLFKLQRDPERASQYLQKLHVTEKFGVDSYYELGLFREIEDHSPEALGFSCRFLAKLVDNMKLMLEDTLIGRGRGVGIHNAFLDWGLRLYSSYLQSSHRSDLNAMPVGLRLTKNEEATLLRAFDRYATERKMELPERIAMRKRLFFSPNQAIRTTPSPRDVAVRPSIYSKIGFNAAEFEKLNSKEGWPFGENAMKGLSEQEVREARATQRFPNRFPKYALELDFVKLYERARFAATSRDIEFDFMLPALLKVREGQSYRNRSFRLSDPLLARALFYIRHFPQHFADLNLAAAPDEAAQIAVYNQIVDRLKVLDKDPGFAKFQESLKKTTRFDYEKSTDIRMPKEPDRAPLTSAPPPPWRSKAPFREPCRELFDYALCDRSLPAAPPFFDETLFPEDPLERELYMRQSQGYSALPKTASSYRLRPERLQNTREGLAMRQSELVQEQQRIELEIDKIANRTFQLRSGRLESVQDLEGESDLARATMSQQLREINPEVIMKEALLTNDPAALGRLRPMLNKDEIEQLMQLAATYYYLKSELLVIEMSLPLIDKVRAGRNEQAEKALAALLDYEFSLDPRQFPEVYFFQAKAKKLLRANQVAIYEWIVEGFELGENRHFQLEPGQGKTSVLTPLMVLRAKRMKMMPVIFTTQAMYAIEKGNLGSHLHELGEELALLEVGLHMKLDAAKLQEIAEDLREAHSTGKALLITPQVYYALRLMYLFAAIKEGDSAREGPLFSILQFFESSTLQILDESHRNLDALTRSIYGVGDFFQLPEKELRLFFRLMRPLLGLERVMCEDGREVSDVGRIAQNLLGQPEDADIDLIRRALARHIASSDLFEIPADDREAFYRYWTDKTAPEPELQKSWAAVGSEMAVMSSLMAYFNLHLCEQVIKERTGLNHGRSIYPEEEHEAPYHNRSPSITQFRDYYKTVALTIKGTYHRPLDEMQIRRLLEKMVAKSGKEEVAYGSDETSTNKKFRTWIDRGLALMTVKELLRDMAIKSREEEALASGSEEAATSKKFSEWMRGTALSNLKLAEISFEDRRLMQQLTAILSQQDEVRAKVQGSPLAQLRLADISFGNQKRMEELTAILSNDEDAKEEALFEFIMAKIGYSSEQFTATPAELLASSRLSVSFSGTPPIAPALPRAIARFKYDLTGAAEVAREFSAERNQEKFFPTGPASCFEELQREKPELLSEATILLDAGFFDMPNEEVAKMWLASNPRLDGVLYFKEGRSLKVDRSEKIMLRLRDGRTIEFEGSQVIESFREHRLDWEKLRIGTYYDAAHVESADLPQKRGAKAIVFLVDRLPFSHFVQLLLRCRTLLDRSMEHSFAWAIQKNLARKIRVGRSGKLDGAALYAWMIKNEASQTRNRLVLAAFQEVGALVQRQVETMRSGIKESSDRIALLKQSKDAYLEYMRHDPYGLFGEHEREFNCHEVLLAFAKDLYRRLAIKEPFDGQIEMRRGIEGIAGDLAKRVRGISANFAKGNSLHSLSGNVEQHCRLQSNVEQRQFLPRPFDPLSSEGIFGSFSVYEQGYPKGACYREVRESFVEGEEKAKQLIPGSWMLSENFYYERNQIVTARNAGLPLGEKFLKPIDYILITIEPVDGQKPKIRAIAMSNDVMESVISDLTNPKPDPEKMPTHSAFLITSRRVLVQAGTGVLEPPAGMVEELLESEWLIDIETDAGLLRGEFLNLNRLIERRKSWPDFETFYRKIVERLPNPETARPTPPELLDPRAISDDEPIALTGLGGTPNSPVARSRTARAGPGPSLVGTVSGAAAAAAAAPGALTHRGAAPESPVAAVRAEAVDRTHFVQVRPPTPGRRRPAAHSGVSSRGAATHRRPATPAKEREKTGDGLGLPVKSSARSGAPGTVSDAATSPRPATAAKAGRKTGDGLGLPARPSARSGASGTVSDAAASPRTATAAKAGRKTGDGLGLPVKPSARSGAPGTVSDAAASPRPATAAKEREKTGDGLGLPARPSARLGASGPGAAAAASPEPAPVPKPQARSGAPGAGAGALTALGGTSAGPSAQAGAGAGGALSPTTGSGDSRYGLHSQQAGKGGLRALTALEAEAEEPSVATVDRSLSSLVDKLEGFGRDPQGSSQTIEELTVLVAEAQTKWRQAKERCAGDKNKLGKAAAQFTSQLTSIASQTKAIEQSRAASQRAWIHLERKGA